MSHPHVIYGSPLVHVDRINHVVRPNPTKEQLKRLEDEFILDCIITEKLRYKWSPDIIPKYDARFDHHAAAYFKSPTQIQLRHHASSPIKPFPFRRPQLDKLTLSGRRRLPPEKTAKELEEKRVNFVNNHVFLTNQVTKDKPLIDPYNAIFDNHSAKYFQKADVKKLLSYTMPSGIHPKVRLRWLDARVHVRTEENGLQHAVMVAKDLRTIIPLKLPYRKL
ncbi:hypothetical protein HOLleu_19823 [Holothuria leucospilota]|uniref:Uncharacterized protein n=1 Tax=Holothuria leucospilota TaxID=206669 RepID=A0A9Q1C0E8_HOLLE|nr:hypothetical protein HOLleu_19823 [Holothuria leucospilota]